ncbi:MAG TPA: hypothetical protein ENN19_01915 [Chloroflexi bacterium]|nr:hypothetical protein [Chloroflexota bacterium]
MIHTETNVAARLLLTMGAVLFLTGVLAMTMMPVVEGKPALQPSPRPTPNLPTLSPTSDQPPTAEPSDPTAEPEPPAPEPAPATPTPAPTPTSVPVLLPDAGGATLGLGLMGIGAGAVLAGLTLIVLRRGG